MAGIPESKYELWDDRLKKSVGVARRRHRSICFHKKSIFLEI